MLGAIPCPGAYFHRARPHRFPPVTTNRISRDRRSLTRAAPHLSFLSASAVFVSFEFRKTVPSCSMMAKAGPALCPRHASRIRAAAYRHRRLRVTRLEYLSDRIATCRSGLQHEAALESSFAESQILQADRRV